MGRIKNINVSSMLTTAVNKIEMHGVIPLSLSQFLLFHLQMQIDDVVSAYSWPRHASLPIPHTNACGAKSVVIVNFRKSYVEKVKSRKLLSMQPRESHLVLTPDVGTITWMISKVGRPILTSPWSLLAVRANWEGLQCTDAETLQRISPSKSTQVRVAIGKGTWIYVWFHVKQLTVRTPL